MKDKNAGQRPDKDGTGAGQGQETEGQGQDSGITRAGQWHNRGRTRQDKDSRDRKKGKTETVQYCKEHEAGSTVHKTGRTHREKVRRISEILDI